MINVLSSRLVARVYGYVRGYVARVVGRGQVSELNEMHKCLEVQEGRKVTFVPVLRISAKLVSSTGVSGPSPHIVSAAFVCSLPGSGFATRDPVHPANDSLGISI
jgi:hypothetical protein